VPRQQKPFVVYKRKDWKSFILTLNPTSGLPLRVCHEWQRKSFQNFPPELINHSQPKTKAAAEAGAMALIAFLKNAGTVVVRRNNVSVGEWLRRFTVMAENPKTRRARAESLKTGHIPNIL